MEIYTLALKMATAVDFEMLEHLQHMMWLNCECHMLDTGHKNIGTTISVFVRIIW
jgi:hypothetical protein